MNLRRAFDVTVAAVALVVSSPIWVVAAIAVKATSKGPVLHRATRIGIHGAPFTLLKFRTMRIEAGPAITAGDDPRVTAAGKTLRRLKIDELPQLVNVLRGEMSLVGPRPEDERYVARYTPEQRRILSVAPGITSPASLAYRDEQRVLASAGERWEEAYVNVVMPAKIAIDLEYIDRRTLATDIGVLTKTAFGVFVHPRR